MNLNKTICQKNIIQKKKKKYYVFLGDIRDVQRLKIALQDMIL